MIPRLREIPAARRRDHATKEAFADPCSKGQVEYVWPAPYLNASWMEAMREAMVLDTLHAFRCFSVWRFAISLSSSSWKKMNE